MFKISSNKIIDAILLFLIMILLEFAYKNFVSEFFSNNGFIYNYRIDKYIITKLLLIVALYFNTFNKKSLYFVSSLFIALMFIPNLIILEFVNNTPFAISFFILLTIIFFSLSNYLTINIKSVNLTIKNKLLVISIIGLLLFLPFIFIYKFDLNFKVLLFQDIYKVRAIGKAKASALTAYSYNWLVKIIFPVALLLSMKYKNVLLFILILTAQLYLFLAQAQKSVFISIFLLGFYYLPSYYKQIRFLLTTIIITIISTSLITAFTGNIMIESIFIRRVFFVPAINNNFYFKFFKDKFIYHSHSILKSVFEYPYKLKPPFLMGKIFYNHPESSVNNGFISDGYMNMGFIGILINIIIIVSYFKIISKLNISPIFSGVFIIIVYTLISSYLLTSLLTHGLLLFLLIAFLLLQNTK